MMTSLCPEALWIISPWLLQAHTPTQWLNTGQATRSPPPPPHTRQSKMTVPLPWCWTCPLGGFSQMCVSRAVGCWEGNWAPVS